MDTEELREKLGGKHIVAVIFDEENRVQEQVVIDVTTDQILLAGELLATMARYMLQSGWAKRDAMQMQQQMNLQQIAQRVARGK